jgi:uncharacterized membrane protein YccC
MAKKLLCLTSLVTAPWLAVGGLVMVTCGVLFDGQPELVVSGTLAVMAAIAAAMAGITAGTLLEAPRRASARIGHRLEAGG